MVSVVELAGTHAERFELHLCTLELAAPAPHVLASRVVGMGSEEMVQRVIEFGNALIANAGSIEIFHDFSEVTGYRAAARRALVDWGVQNPGAIERTNVLFRSRVVAMGVSMATRLLRGRLTGYSNYPEFDAARSAAARRRP